MRNILNAERATQNRLFGLDQPAIAKVLEHLRVKTHALKQGMMQEFLTGKPDSRNLN